MTSVSIIMCFYTKCGKGMPEVAGPGLVKAFERTIKFLWSPSADAEPWKNVVTLTISSIVAPKSRRTVFMLAREIFSGQQCRPV